MGKIKLIQGTIPYLYTTTPQLIYGSIPFVTAPVKTLSAVESVESPPSPPPSGASVSSINGVLKANISSLSGIPTAQIVSISGISWD